MLCIQEIGQNIDHATFLVVVVENGIEYTMLVLPEQTKQSEHFYNRNSKTLR